MGMEVVRTFKPQRQDPADGMDDQQAVTGGATLNSHYLSSNPSSMLGFSRVIAVIYIYILHIKVHILYVELPRFRLANKYPIYYSYLRMINQS